MAGTKRTTRSKAAPAKRSASPVEEKVHVLTKPQFSKLSSAIVKDYAVHNGLDPDMARKDIAAALFGAHETILAGHRMKWSAPWTPQNASTSLPAGPSHVGPNAARESDIESSERRLRNGEIADPAEQRAVKSEVISAALLSIGNTNAAARRLLNGDADVGEGSRAQPLVVDADAHPANHAFANQTTLSGPESRISATSQNSYPSPAVSALDSPAMPPLAASESLSNVAGRLRQPHAPAAPSKLGLGKRTRDDDQGSDHDADSMQEGESEEGPSERPAKQQRRTAASRASPESSTAGQNHATPSSPPVSPRLTAAQKGKGKAVAPASPPTPRSPALEPVPTASAANEHHHANTTGGEVVDLQQDINAAHIATSALAAPIEPPTAASSSAQATASGLTRAHPLTRTRHSTLFAQPTVAASALEAARMHLTDARDRNRDSRDFLRQTHVHQQAIEAIENEAKAIRDAARRQVEHARVILGYEQARRHQGRAKLERHLKAAVARDEGAINWDDEALSDDELEPTELLNDPRRNQDRLFSRQNEDIRSAYEWWQKRVEWKAFHRANKRRMAENSVPGAVPVPLYTAKDIPMLVQAQRERALEVIKEAQKKRETRATLEAAQMGGDNQDEAARNELPPFVRADFEGNPADEDLDDPEEDGWLVWDWFTGPTVITPRGWEPSFVGYTSESSYYPVF